MRCFPIFFLLLFGLSNGQNLSKENLIISAQDIYIPLQYTIHKTPKAITIDGKDNEPVWRDTSKSSSFVDIEGNQNPKPAYNTYFKMLWDTDYLYIYARLEEPHIWGDITRRDEVIFYNNDFEIFVNPSNDTFRYGEIEINALNTVWDLLLTQPYSRTGRPINAWNLEGLKSKTYCKGSLNNSNDTDEYWAVEMAIPMKTLAALKTNTMLPVHGESWRMNFSRVQWQHQISNGKYQRKKIKEKYLPEHNWVWSPQMSVNMHLPEMWGIVIFSEDSSKTLGKVDFQKIQLEQIAYAIYRKLRQQKITASVGQKHTFETINVHNTDYQITVYGTLGGYQISVKDIDHQQKIYLTENGHPVSHH